MHDHRRGGLRHRHRHGVGEQVRDGQRHCPAEGVFRGRGFDEDGDEVSLCEPGALLYRKG